MIEKLSDSYCSGQGLHEIMMKINEIIDVFNTMQELCKHEWIPKGEDFACLICGEKLDCDHEWKPFGHDSMCKKCGIIK